MNNLINDYTNLSKCEKALDEEQCLILRKVRLIKHQPLGLF